MKTLQLSTLVLLLVSVFSSCTKEEATKNDGAVNATGRNKANAAIEINYNPNPAPLSSTVYVTGTLTFDKAVNQFSYTVEKSTTQNGTDANGNIIWTDFQPTKYTETVKLVDGVTATTFPLHFDFPASDAGLGKTGWQLHISGQDVKNVVLGAKTLEIVNDPPACNGLTLEGKVIDAAPTEGEQGMYTFTVQYTVNPCDLKFNMLKTQGGLTNGIVLLESVGGLDRQPGSSTNKVITWTEGEKGGAELPSGNRVYTVKFKKAYSGSGEIELTGDWSVSASLLDGSDVKVTYAKIYYSK